MLTSWPGVPTSRAVRLNGRALALADARAGTLPPLAPAAVAAGADVALPARSYGFVVLPDVGAAACA